MYMYVTSSVKTGLIHCSFEHMIISKCSEFYTVSYMYMYIVLHVLMYMYIHVHCIHIHCTFVHIVQVEYLYPEIRAYL